MLFQWLILMNSKIETEKGRSVVVLQIYIVDFLGVNGLELRKWFDLLNLEAFLVKGASEAGEEEKDN